MEPDRYQRIISKNLKAIRKSKGLSAKDIADILGVSQAKVTYIEHCKGVLSARDVAILSRRLNVALSEFFRGLEEPEDKTEAKELASQLARYGAVLLARPSNVSPAAAPFEEIFSRSLAYTEDDRFNKGICTILISQAASKEIHADRIFARIGSNRYLVEKAAEVAQLSLQICKELEYAGVKLLPRARLQIEKIKGLAEKLAGQQSAIQAVSAAELQDITEFVKGCLDAQP
jgi:transcriptional regulator with XRE-family HTH domain